jgi:hypothetical protein
VTLGAGFVAEKWDEGNGFDGEHAREGEQT